MTEETIYLTPTVFFRAGRGTLEAATVDGEKGRALFVFRDEDDAEEYRLTTSIYSAEEGFKPVSLEVGRSGMCWQRLNARTLSVRSR